MLVVKRELRHLDPRTLADIGAPQGLVGQHRWQAEQDDWRRDAAPHRLVAAQTGTACAGYSAPRRMDAAID